MENIDYKKIKVLIADDSQNMLRTIANMLRLLGFEQVIRAENGETALRKIRSEMPDMVLSDWNMPRMTGVELLRAVREDESLQDMPFLMITAEVDLDTVAEAGEIEVDGYLLKPFTQEDLKNKIDEILKKKFAPSPVEIHLSVFQVYLKARQFELAKAELEKLPKSYSKNPRVNYALGQLHEAQGDFENALKAYQRSVEFNDLYLKGHAALARVHQERGDLDSALEHLRTAVTISPKNSDRQFALGQALIQAGQMEEGLKVMKNVMALAKEKRPEMIEKIGEVYLEAGMAAEAQAVFQQALDDNPEALHIYNRMGIALRRQKKFDEAAENYRRALAIEPENEVLYFNLGRACYDAGKKEMAVSAMKRALQIFPEFEEAKSFLGRIEKT